MHVITLGTASAYPSPERGVSCTALRLDDGSIWLFDCGEGSQIQLQKSSLRITRINKIFITHLHGDHIFGLPGLICTLGMHLSTSTSCGIHIYGPQGIRKFLRTALILSFSQLPFNYTVHELILDSNKEDDVWKSYPNEATDPLHPQEVLGQDIHAKECIWNLYEDEKISICAGPVKHVIPCVGFVVTEKDRPGRLITDRLIEMGVPPGPIYGQIKNGKIVTLPDGTILIPENFMEAPKKGCKITILGDTSDPYKMADISRDSDILFHEATLQEALKDKALEHGHSTPVMAAQFAVDINAKKLVLFHFSQRYRPSEKENQKSEENDVNILLEEAESVVKKNLSNCPVILASDLMELKI